MTTTQINKRRRAEGKPPLNFKLIRKVIKRIETTPESYAQQTYVSKVTDFNNDIFHISDGKKRPAPMCGTVACIAGETIICNAPTIKLGVLKLSRIKHSWSDKAREMLGLTRHETDLFDGEADSWIEPFRSQFKNAKTYKGEARAAINYLKYIVATGKVTE